MWFLVKYWEQVHNNQQRWCQSNIISLQLHPWVESHYTPSHWFFLNWFLGHSVLTWWGFPLCQRSTRLREITKNEETLMSQRDREWHREFWLLLRFYRGESCCTALWGHVTGVSWETSMRAWHCGARPSPQSTMASFHGPPRAGMNSNVIPRRVG